MGCKRKKVKSSQQFFFGTLNPEFNFNFDQCNCSSCKNASSSFNDCSCSSCRKDSSSFKHCNCFNSSSSFNSFHHESFAEDSSSNKCPGHKPKCKMPCIAHGSLYRPDVIGAPPQFVADGALVQFTVKGPEKCALADPNTHSIRVLNNGDYNLAFALRLVGTFVDGVGGTPDISIRASIFVDGELDSTSTLVFNSEFGTGFDLTFSKPIQRFLHAGAVVDVRFHNVVLIPFTGGMAQALVEDASLVITQIDKGHF